MKAYIIVLVVHFIAGQYFENGNYETVKISVQNRLFILFEYLNVERAKLLAGFW